MHNREVPELRTYNDPKRIIGKQTLMELQHIAISISDSRELEAFYQNILGFTFQRSFTIDSTLSRQIFDIPEQAQVSIVQNGNIVLEIFETGNIKDCGYAHICLSVPDRETIAQKAELKNYNCLRIPRGEYQLIFIRDKDGNIFELKESKG